jgi:hypothetical protein
MMNLDAAVLILSIGAHWIGCPRNVAVHEGRMDLERKFLEDL